MQLQPHQQRVVTEQTELNDKLTKLSSFIKSENFQSIVKDEAERSRLTKQEKIMKEYSEVLTERIAAFTS